jgi:hypothetical protein
MIYEQSFTKQARWLLSIFVVFTITGALYSELFQAPQKVIDHQSFYQNPLNDEFLESINEVHYTNRIENITMSKGPYHWNLIFPRNLLADSDSISSLFSALRQIQVRKLYPKDTININNFSLSDPLLKLKLIGTDKTIDFKLGIINPIDQSAYISINTTPYIYQIEFFKQSIETFGLSDFINSHVIVTPKRRIKQLQIYRGKLGGFNLFHVDWIQNAWRGDRERILNQDKVDKFLNALFKARSHIILDDLTAKQMKKFDQYFNYPPFTMKITTKEGTEIELSVTNPLPAIPHLKIEKRQHVMIKVSNRKAYLVIDKDFLKLLNNKTSDFVQKKI